MTVPVLMVIDDDSSSLAALDGTLRRRYGQDYLIVSDASPPAALGRLRELRAGGREVPVVMAASALTTVPATRPLAAAAVEYARTRGAKAVEEYPMLRKPGQTVPWGEMNVGSRSTFTAAGFREVSHLTTLRVVMGLDLD